jgi:hypothetical protein
MCAHTVSDTLFLWCILQYMCPFEYIMTWGLFLCLILHSEGGRRTDFKLIPVRSFAQSIQKLTVLKRPGKEHISLLSDESSSSDNESNEDDESSSMWSSFSSFFGKKKTEGKKGTLVKKKEIHDKVDDEDNRIHVFSLATGHMYERLLRYVEINYKD